MVFSVSPSVIVKEIDATVTIPAISNSPAAIVGPFNWGPIDERVLITSENSLVSIFGKPSDFNSETFFTAADFLAYSNALYVTRVVSGNSAIADHADGEFKAKYVGDLGNAIDVSYVISSNDFSKLLFSAGDVSGNTIPFGSTTLQITVGEDLLEVGENQVKSKDILRIGNASVGYQEIPVSTIQELSADANTSTYEYNITLGSTFRLSEFNPANLTFTRKWKYAGFVSKAPSSGNMHIVVVDRSGAITGTAGSILEIYEDVSKSEIAKLADGTNNYYKAVIELKSNWIEADSVDIEEATAREYISLSGGANGDGENTSTVISLGALMLGYDLYKEPDDVDISFVLQGKAAHNSNLANYLISNITEYRKDCVAFISPRKEDVVNVANPNTQLENVLAFRNQIAVSSSYWFMDSGYKKRYDKYNDTYRWVPLNGDIGGLCARIDPWESPAGYKRGAIRNSIQLAFNPNKPMRDQLYGNEINPVINIVGQGTLLFGDKTGLGQFSAFDRINVRRLFIVVEKAIATVAATFLFDFNDEFTQSQFKNLVEPFLRDIQGKRGIIDFRVVSDATVNTPDVIDRNIFRGNIFIKPARTINVIELNFIATRTGVTFDEIISQTFNNL